MHDGKELIYSLFYMICKLYLRVRILHSIYYTNNGIQIMQIYIEGVKNLRAG